MGDICLSEHALCLRIVKARGWHAQCTAAARWWWGVLLATKGFVVGYALAHYGSCRRASRLVIGAQIIRNMFLNSAHTVFQR